MHRTNPRLDLTDGDWEMVRLWRMSQGGLSGPGPLLEPGGLLDQVAAMIEAFNLMSAAEAELKKESGQ